LIAAGVEIVNDLQDLYCDVKMLNDLKTKLSGVEFNRFIRAASQTTLLNKVVIPTHFSGAGGAGGAGFFRWLLPSNPSITMMLDEEERKLREKLAVKRIEESAITSRIEKLRKELEAANLAAEIAHKFREEEKLLKANRERKVLIDG
jgi:hypothetical protein